MKNVLPEKCRNDTLKAYYEAELERPQATIDACKSMLVQWVLDLWDKGALLKFKQYASKPIQYRLEAMQNLTY